MLRVGISKNELPEVSEDRLENDWRINWRPAKSGDLNFFIQIYDDCVQPAHGQFPLHKDAVAQFSGDPVRVVLSNFIRGHSEVHYFVVERSGDALGVVCNLRNPETNFEEVGMLLNSSERAKGIGTDILKRFIEFRKRDAIKITGVVAKENIPCQIISMRAGGVKVGESKVHLSGQAIDVVHFVFHGEL